MRAKKLLILTLIITNVFIGQIVTADSSTMTSSTFNGLKFRNIGPAFMSGRIADVAIHPEQNNIWYVAVGSGGVWKTTNAGTTWKPLFDKQPVYSIGTITLDPSNPSTVWVGSGENVSGRHVGFGDGVYVSHDAGKSWQNVGLKNSEHISEIIVHPNDSNIVWVAAQGPLWSKGGQRGLYKTTDGGATWTKQLGDSEWVGVTDLAMDPRNPDRLYAVTWQRHRTVAALMDGGPGTGIHRSEDGGKTWVQLNPAKPNQKNLKQLNKKSGLPEGHMGKIGFAISPANPDVVYAAIELNRRKGGLYRSTDRGASWKKMSNAVAGATGPHYYQELYASPHDVNEIYIANVRMLKSTDGGKTFKTMKEEHKHSDNHSLNFLPSHPGYLLMGSDGGLYESYDKGKTWRYMDNLPITQYYKVAVDDAMPFYNVFGGTQDNGTQAGPSRTDNANGIRNSDWKMILFGDGHQPATEPGNPDIVYSQWQQGNLVRIDRTNDELVYIQPQPQPGEPEERFNWDAPIIVSPHDPKRIYHASQRVWRSDDRGDSWTVISGDLTKNLDRIKQPIMDGQPGWDAPWDMWAMSKYSTITSLSESPVKEGLIYAGTDDGLIQITENGGKNWRKVKVGSLPGVPDEAFVNDIKADLYDADTVYIALDNHKFGDYKPYLLKSTNRGKSWKSIASNLPAKHLVWRLVQDHVKPNLLFAATEFGIFFTPDGGKRWVELNGGVPTIAFRDAAIQTRENDLVLASFGRSFYVLDDYSALREVSDRSLSQQAKLFKPRKAYWYIQKGPLTRNSLKGYQGANHYTAENPPFGVTFTYYLKDKVKTAKDIRLAKEKPLHKEGKNIPFPGWNAVERERRQQEPVIWFTITDSNDQVVRRIKGKNKKGIQRVSWDLKLPSVKAVMTPKAPKNNDYIRPSYMAAPGEYTVTMSQQLDGEVKQLGEPQQFTVEQINMGALKGASAEEVVSFWKSINQLKRDSDALHQSAKLAIERIGMIELALENSTAKPGQFSKRLHDIRTKLLEINHVLNGDQSRAEVYLSNVKTINNLISVLEIGTSFSSYGPTPTHQAALTQANAVLAEQSGELKEIIDNKLPALEKEIEASGAPWIKGQTLK